MVAGCGADNVAAGRAHIATDRSLPWLNFADPSIPPLYFKISDWRDAVPRVVVSFGCSNDALLNSRDDAD